MIMVMPSCADLLSGFALVMPHCARKERATRITSCTSRKSLSSSAKCQCACENGKDREVRKLTSAEVHGQCCIESFNNSGPVFSPGLRKHLSVQVSVEKTLGKN